ncbi:GNAT family N-acetyltransferase [Ornithinimicrobium cavernae]|uniref:GNAT family N-acetyltransferase n=1 Tax=Ornithinimicrobium cavernae TaxID=2666047 RepID=UPI000D69D68A|nr:GNAT family N-acetyltransferase [Ornithinimicrobium cavernae]
MEVRVITSSEELAGLGAEWEELEARPHTPYYVRHRFVTAWWNSYRQAPGYRLHVVTVRQNGRLVGIGPFAIRPEQRSGQPVRVLRWASHGDYLSLLHADDSHGSTARPEVITQLILQELTRLVDDGTVVSVHLTGIPSESDFAWHVRKSQDYHQRLAFLVENPYLDLSDGYTTPSHTTKYRNKLLREHELTFAVFHGAEHQILERIAAVHVAEKQHLVEHGRDERHSLYEDPRRLEHIRGVFEGTRDAVTFAYVEGEDPATGTIAAYRTVFRDAGRLLSWNSAYLPAYERYRMGKVLQLRILEHLCGPEGEDLGVQEFDFGAGRYPWKFEWTPSLRATYRLLIKAPLLPEKAAPIPPKKATSPPEAGTQPRRPEQRPPAQPAAAPSEASDARRSTVRRRTARLARRVAPHLPAVIVAPARRLVRAQRVRRSPVTIWYAPHPDDETIFMAGSLASVRNRRKIIVLLTAGESSRAIEGINRKLDRPISRAEFVASRDRELRAATRHLGVARRDIVRVGLPDNGLRAEDVLDVIRAQARRFPGASHRTMSYLDIHPDHAAAGEALLEAHRQHIVEDVLFHLPVPQVRDDRASRVTFGTAATEAKLAALREYCVWEPAQGRYAVGRRSVSELIRHHRRTPDELVHGPELPPPD